jgi:hypothetical protein
MCRILNFHNLDTVKSVIPRGECLRRLNFNRLPHRLNPSRKAKRARASRGLPAFIEITPERQLGNWYTGDETWLDYANSKTAMRASTGSEMLSCSAVVPGHGKNFSYPMYNRRDGFLGEALSGVSSELNDPISHIPE